MYPHLPLSEWPSIPEPLERPVVGLAVIAPVRCPHCRSRLTARRWLAPSIKWCRRCRCTVQYLGPLDIAPDATGYQTISYERQAN